ncbi:Nn.00g076770.m01.CDS01 [Neocucurbitaria sp. VM-36]
MASADDSTTAYSGLLALPTELRCHVYDYLLTDSQTITISAGYMTVFGNTIRDRARKVDIPGLPLDLAPLVRCHHDITLLSVAKPPTIAIDACVGEGGGEKLVYTAPMALSQTCRLVNDELMDYMRGKRWSARARSSQENLDRRFSTHEEEGLSLYVSYPYGILVLKSLYPFLLKQARRVHISGHYTAPKEVKPASTTSPKASEGEHLTPTNSVAASFGTTTPMRSFNEGSSEHNPLTPIFNDVNRPRLRLDRPSMRPQQQYSLTKIYFPSYPPDTATIAPTVLAQLVRTLLPAEPTQVAEISARILYPGCDTYNSVWSDENSPALHILRNICGGKIDMKVKRASLGTGLYLTARPNPEERIVSTSWENWRMPRRARFRGMDRLSSSVDAKDFDAVLQGATDIRDMFR